MIMIVTPLSSISAAVSESFAVDFDGSLYVFDTDLKIIKTTGFVNSLAGNTSPFGALDGKGSAAHSTLQSV